MPKIIKSKPTKREWVNEDGSKGFAWVINWRYDNEKRRRRKQFNTYKEAIEWAPEDAEVSTGDSGLTIADAVKIWLDACKIGRKGRPPVEPLTLKGYETQANRHIIPLIGDKRLAQFKREDVYEYRDKLLTRLSREHAKKVWTLFKAVLNEAVARGKIGVNVAAEEHIHISKRERKRVEVPEPEEVTRILAKLDELATQPNRQHAKRWRRYRAMINTLAFAGIRTSELRGVAWPNFKSAERILVIEQRADDNHVLGAPKSASGYREIQLDKELVRLLREWQIECPPSKKKLMFPNHKGNVESRANIYSRCWKPLLQRAGIVDENGEPKYTLHSLRHFRASMLIDSGATPLEVKDEMGHSSIQVTYDLYGHLFKKRDEKRRIRADEIAAELRPRS